MSSRKPRIGVTSGNPQEDRFVKQRTLPVPHFESTEEFPCLPSREPVHTFPFPMPSELPACWHAATFKAAGLKVDSTMVKVKEVPVPGTDYCKVVTEDDSKVAILFSPWGGDSSWTSWAFQSQSSHPEHITQKLRRHSFIIRYIFAQDNHSMPYEELMTKYIGFPDDFLPCSLGFDKLMIQFVPQGSLYTISAHDGNEHVEVFDPSLWHTA